MAGLGEAVGKLARERSLAESGAALLKGHGEQTERIEGQRLYAVAKAEFDGLIEELLTGLAQGVEPEGSIALRAAIERAAARRRAFSEHVDRAVQPPEGRKGIGGDILGGIVAAVVAGLLEAAVAIWKVWREADAARRREIATRLEAQRWAAFADIKAG